MGRLTAPGPLPSSFNFMMEMFNTPPRALP